MSDRAWLVDASIALMWFLPSGQEAHRDLALALIGRLDLATTSLGEYEVASVLTRNTGLSEVDIVRRMALLRETCGSPLSLEPPDDRRAVELARQHGLTFYDASYAAIAQRTGRLLLSADRDLLDPGLAISLHDVPPP